MERIRRAANRIREQRSEQLDLNGKSDIDLGVKVFKLDRSNFSPWKAATIGLEAEEFAKQLDIHADHLDPRSTREDFLYELLLKSGFSLVARGF